MQNLVRNILSVCAIAALVQSPVQAKSSVWKVAKGENTLYLAGTIHVLSESDYPLPCEYQDVYSKSEKIVFETDMSVLSSPSFGAEAAKIGMYPIGESLSDKLSSKTNKALTDYLISIGLPAEGLMQFKPGMLMSVIAISELKKIGVSGKGVDQHFFGLATGDQKKIGQLETPESQLEMIAGLGVGNEDNFITYLIDSMELFREEFTDLLTSWRIGDLEELAEASGFEQMREEFPKLFKTLIVERNNDWLTQIEAMLTTEEVEAVFVGGLHMVGEEGLLANLSNKGYKIAQLDGCSLTDIEE